MTAEREEVGVVVRSECHDATWIGHMGGATFSDTPAGPLRVVKQACEEWFRRASYGDDVAVRWRHEDDDWIIEAKEDA